MSKDQVPMIMDKLWNARFFFIATLRPTIITEAVNPIVLPISQL
jgi:hypothetical protein